MSPRNNRFIDVHPVIIKADDPASRWTFREKLDFALGYEPLVSLSAEDLAAFKAAAVVAQKPLDLPPEMWLKFNQAYSTGLRKTRG